jgi:chaperone BCS1
VRRVLQWISQNAQRSQHLGVRTAFRQDNTTGVATTQFDYVPSPGMYVFASPTDVLL